MGYRLDIYKNSVTPENNIYYGTKLIGYCDYHEYELLCVKYLCSIRDDIEPDDFGYYFTPEVELTIEEFKKFIQLYMFDLAHEELHYPFPNNDTDFDHVYKVIDNFRKEITEMANIIDADTKCIIVRWC